MNGFLELTDEVPEGVGARMSGRISGDITVIPDEPKQDDSKPEIIITIAMIMALTVQALLPLRRL